MAKDATTCLFCGRIIFPPQRKMTDAGDVIYGKCECGAIYVCDPTGHNQGQALVDAMLLISPEGIDNIEFGTNFDMKEHDYDWKTHRYLYVKQGLFTGKLFFIKALEGGVVKPEMSEKIKLSKKDFIAIIEKREFEKIQKFALQNKNAIGWTISLSYDKENLISWKAVEAMGYIAKAYIEAGDTETLRNTIRKLLWSMTDESGAIGWRAAELIGEIVYAEPKQFEDIIPIIWSSREEESFLESVLRSIIKLSEKIQLNNYLNIDCQEIETLLRNENNEIKALSALLSSRAHCQISIPQEIKNITFSLYKDGKIVKTTVSEAEKIL